MRKATTASAVAALALGATLVGTTVASAGHGVTEATTIHIIDRDDKVAFHDFNHNGPDFGDIVAFRSIVTNPQGKTVGHGIGQVTLLGAQDNLLTYTAVLAGGDITMQGDITGLAPGAHSQLAVTGGTGRYGNVHGVTAATQIGQGVTDLVIRLVP